MKSKNDLSETDLNENYLIKKLKLSQINLEKLEIFETQNFYKPFKTIKQVNKN